MMREEITTVADLERALKRMAKLAFEDSKVLGSGYIRFTQVAGGKSVIERLPPSRVLYFPDDPEIPD